MTQACDKNAALTYNKDWGWDSYLLLLFLAQINITLSQSFYILTNRDVCIYKRGKMSQKLNHMQFFQNIWV